MKNYIIQGIIIFILLFVVATIPFVLQQSWRGVELDLQKAVDLFMLLPDIHWEYRLNEVFFKSTLSTFFLLLISMIFGLSFALLFGLFFARFKVFRIFRAFLNVFSIVPDFIIIIFAVILAVNFYQWTGFRIISFMPDKKAEFFWFPVMVLSIAPAFYFLKLISLRFHQTSGEDYVKVAVSKGLKVPTINLQYVYRNMQPYIHAELTKGLSLTIGNLFIVEYLLNVIGLTHYIFAVESFSGTLLGLFALLIVAFFVLIIVKLLLHMFRKGFIYE